MRSIWMQKENLLCPWIMRSKNEMACPDASTVTWKADPSEVKVASTSDTLNHTDGNVLYRVYWKWDYMRANKDQEDTDIGRNGTTTQTIKATVKEKMELFGSVGKAE